MKLRVLLGLQLCSVLLLIMAFIAFVAFTVWNYLGMYLPWSITLGQVQVPLYIIASIFGGLFLLLILFSFLLVFLFIDRLFIQPIKIITDSMSRFAASSTFTPLPNMSLSTREIHDLANVFVQFTDNVEQVHNRDTEISRVKSDFISTAAHQLRTPLTGIRWALEALVKEPLTETQKMLVEDAANKSRDLVAIVGTLLDISSIESGKHKYVFEQLQLSELVSEVVRDFTHQAAERTITLRLEDYPETLPLVRADRQQVKWVLNNLIENAIKYTPAGGTVRIMIDLAPQRVRVRVKDTGIGITGKDRNNIFERFYRAENAIAKENKGNGLGLYIARTIATDHGGDLDFSANEDSPGTTFALSLPTLG